MRIFLAVATELSFTAAAAKLHMTQPALTSAVTTLENQFGHRLFERTTRRVQLTQAGELFLDTASKLLTEIDKSLYAAQLNADRLHGHISFSAPTWFVRFIAPSVLARLTPLRPEITVSMYSYAGQQAIQEVLEDNLDFAICGATAISSGLVVETFLEDKVGMIVSQEAQAHYNDIVRWSELDHRKYISVSLATGISQLLIMNGLSLDLGRKPICQVSDSSALVELVETGLGYGIISRMSAHLYSRRKQLKFIPLIDPSISRRLYLIKRKNKQLSDGAALVLRELLGDARCLYAFPDVRIALTHAKLNDFVDS